MFVNIANAIILMGVFTLSSEAACS